MADVTKKIRVALIGLNAPYEGSPTGTSWAAAAHLPYLKQSNKFELVALQNSSTERAAKAIKAYGLDPTTVKAYGSPEEVANDPNIDMVVSCIRVDRHLDSVRPSILAGKDVYVEWPLEANIDKAKELDALVREHHVKNIVGLQGAFSPIVNKLKKLIESGVIGKVESSDIVGRAYGGQAMNSAVDYFTEKDVGGNMLTIAFGHSMEFIFGVLGDPIPSQTTSLLHNQHEKVNIVDVESGKIVRVAQNTVPTQLAFSSVLDSGIFLNWHIYCGPLPKDVLKFKDTSGGNDLPNEETKIPLLDWRIRGTRGDIHLRSYATWSLQVDLYDLDIRVINFPEDDTKITAIEKIEFDSAEYQGSSNIEVQMYRELPMAARGIAKIYENFWEATQGHDKPGKTGEPTNWYPDFALALKRHEMIERLWRDQKERKEKTQN